VSSLLAVSCQPRARVPLCDPSTDAVCGRPAVRLPLKTLHVLAMATWPQQRHEHERKIFLVAELEADVARVGPDMTPGQEVLRPSSTRQRQTTRQSCTVDEDGECAHKSERLYRCCSAEAIRARC
jgi:hypothetical protein